MSLMHMRQIAGRIARAALPITMSFCLATASVVGAANAGPLMDRIAAGEPIRIAFIAAPPTCYQQTTGAAGGFAPTITVGTLKAMGYENIESVVLADWGGLIPGLMAGQYDIVSCGMYVMGERCRNVAFSNPMATASDVFVVPTGNPKGIKTWQDVIDTGATVAFVAGTNSLSLAKAAGVPDSQLMALPGRPEITGALLSGRVDAAHWLNWEAGSVVAQNKETLEIIAPETVAEDDLQWASNAFRHQDADFVAAFNAAQSNYLGSPEMMAAAATDGYTESMLPAKDVTAEWACENR